MTRIIKTLFIAFILCIVWELLEIILYHEIQARTVDDIMMIIFIPFIYKSTRKEVEE